MPVARSDFWHEKFQSNVVRDRRNVADLKKAGWRVLRIWECELRPTCIRRTVNKTVRMLNGKLPVKPWDSRRRG